MRSQNLILLVFALSFFCLSTTRLSAQQTATYDNPAATYKIAIELFNKEMYGAAQESFRKVMKDPNTHDATIKMESEYFDAICAMELNHPDADYRINQFIKNYPESSKTKLIFYQLGKLEFRNKQYRKALDAFRKVDRYNLSAGERDEYFFKTGYCYLKAKDGKNARNNFDNVKGERSKYGAPATYYIAHLDYLNGDYDKALAGFNKLSNDRNYKKVIPYYVVHIYYYQGQYDKILEVAPDLYQDASNKRKPEIARLIGDAYYREGNFVKAKEYLEIYEKSSRKTISREDRYQIGFTYFMTENFDMAIEQFQGAIGRKDALSQNAFYHLGFCYIHSKEARFAMNAFLSAQQLNFDPDIKEDALFNYVKVCIDEKNDPYKQAVKSLENYIQQNPNSPRREEAYGYLMQLFLTTRNYEAALSSVEKINLNSNELKTSVQKIYFFRGIELFNATEYEKAVALFDKAIKNNRDKSITVQSYYWMADGFYRLKNYWGSQKYLKMFLESRNARELEFYNMANYNLAYTYFNRKNYRDAATYFKRFLDDKNNEEARFVNDAYLRLGDCNFISKLYTEAIRYYDQSIKMRQANSDYATYKKALAYGAKGDFKNKIITLEQISRMNKSSIYYDDALYELAQTALITNDNRKALIYLDQLVKDKPKSPFSKKALMRTGLIYYNNNQNDKAIAALKQVITNFSGTPEAREALNSLRNIYVDMNRVDDYFAFANSLEFANVSTSEQDSLQYVSAENLYMEGDCDKASPAFRYYLDKFPNGGFTLNASFYKAECDFRNKNFTEALSGYEAVIAMGRSNFSETSLIKAARITYIEKEYEKALNYYNEIIEIAENKEYILEAYHRATLCSYNLEKWDDAINLGKKLMMTENVSSEQLVDAHYVLAKSYFAKGNLEQARSEFNITERLTQGEKGAESKYYLCEILYATGKYKEAEETIFELIENYSNYDYWLASSFILLADVYMQSDNIFQAKQTLQSIIDNYDGPELGDIAYNKLQKIIKLEEEQKAKEFDDAEEELIEEPYQE